LVPPNYFAVMVLLILSDPLDRTLNISLATDF